MLLLCVVRTRIAMLTAHTRLTPFRQIDVRLRRASTLKNRLNKRLDELEEDDDFTEDDDDDRFESE